MSPTIITRCRCRCSASTMCRGASGHRNCISSGVSVVDIFLSEIFLFFSCLLFLSSYSATMKQLLIILFLPSLVEVFSYQICSQTSDCAYSGCNDVLKGSGFDKTAVWDYQCDNVWNMSGQVSLTVRTCSDFSLTVWTCPDMSIPLQFGHVRTCPFVSVLPNSKL